MEFALFAVKLMIPICLLRIPGVMADPTKIKDSVIMYYYSDTRDELSVNNTMQILPHTADTNTFSTLKGARFSVNSDYIYYYANCHNEGECSFECDSGNADTLFTELTPIYNQHLGCSECGISVTLTEGVNFPENRVRSYWRIGNIELSRFEVNLNGVTNVESNAFSDQAFRFVESLVLTGLQITVFNNGTFNGLTSLRSLRLYALKTYDFTPGFLTGISATLSYLFMNGPGNFRTSNKIDGLTGGIALPSVQLFQITTNLNGSLTSRTFSALKNIRVLVLSDCQIEVITPEIFKPIQSTLQKLYLERNRLKTIHQDIFNIIFHIQREMFIYLYGNPWHCDGDMETYKNFLRNFAWRFQGAESTCVSPPHLRNVLVKNADIWTDPPETTAVSTLDTTVEPPTTEAGVINPECPSSSLPSDIASIPIRSQTLTLGLSQNENGELMVTQTSHIPSALTLVWFQSDSQSVFHQNTDQTLNCLRLISFKTVIPNLVLDTAYTFCLIDQSSLLLSPWDCGSYYHKTPKKITTWLAADNLASVIGGTAIALMLSLLLGTILGVLILRQNPNWLKSKNDVHKNQYISGQMHNRLSNQSVAEFSLSDVNNYELTLHKLANTNYMDHSESLCYPERMPYDVPPPLPVRMELEKSFGERTNDYHDTDIYENHYSTLEEAYYKRLV